MIQTGDRILCVDAAPKGLYIPILSGLQSGKDYIAGHIHTCSCGRITIEIGLVLNYKGSQRLGCDCGITRKPKFHYYDIRRFVKRQEKVRYNSVKTSIKIEEPVLT